MRDRPIKTSEDQFAEYLAQGLSPQDAAERMGLRRGMGNAKIQRLRQRLGWQAQ